MRVALYIRIVNDSIRDAIPYQEQELRRWSNEHRCGVVEVFKDSAPRVLVECSGLQRLLVQLGAHTFGGAVVRGLNRLARSYYDSPQLTDKFQKVGAKIAVPYDTDDVSAEHKTGLHILGTLKATWEHV